MNTPVPAFLRSRPPETPMNSKDITAFEGRPEPQMRREPTPLRLQNAVPQHPEVVSFLNKWRDLEIERDHLAEENAQVIAELHSARQTIIDYSQTIRELTAQRDRFMRTSTELEVRITEIGASCHRALTSAGEARDRAEDSIRTNEESAEERDRRITEHLGKTFGAGNEPNDGVEQPS